MKLYEVLEDYGGYEPGQSFGLFSTYEKANDFIKMFEGYDGFGISEDDLYKRGRNNTRRNSRLGS